jgi:HupE / UreJ protein
MTRLLVTLVLLAIAASSAYAHERSRSNSVWIESETGVIGQIFLDARQATLFLSLSEDGTSLEAVYQQRLIDGLRVSRGPSACALNSPPLVNLRADGRLEGRGNWDCPETGTLEIDVQVFSPLSANHVHFIRLQTEDGIQERILARGQTTADFSNDAHADPAGWTGFLTLGFEHILGGPDHVAFVLGLMLIVTGWKRLTMVTLGFTLGHSVTLALAVLGWVSPPGAAIESLIGFSILFIAAEAAFSRPSDFRQAGWGGAGVLLTLAGLSALTGGLLAWPVWLGLIILTVFYYNWLGQGGRVELAAPLLSGGFGLVHGVGFAGILLEIDIADEQLLPSLLGFNIGVELGQIAIVVAVLALLPALRLFAPERALYWGRAVMIAALAGLGTFWFIGRAFGA